MNSRALREIPLRILKRKVGDENVTLLQACYDNPICNDDDTKGFPSQHRSGKSQEYGTDVFEDGLDVRGSAFSASKHSTPCHVANDYMHSVPPSRSMPNEITFRAHRKRSRLIMLLLIGVVVAVAVTIGLIVYYIGHDSSSSSSLTSSSSPVITLANVQGSLTVIGGPFAVYNAVMADTSTLAFSYIRNAFVFQMDKIFMSSDYASFYNRTQMSLISNNKSHVQLSFVIHVQPHTTASANLLEHLKYVLVNGFKESIFDIDEASTTLKAMVIAPSMVPTPPPGQCQPVQVLACVNITKYSSTTFPNLLGHVSPQEVEMSIRHKYDQLFLLKHCYGYATDFYCAVFAPECGSGGKAIPPCRKYCHDVMASCNGSYTGMAPLPFTCVDFPDSEDPKVCRQNPYRPGECVSLSTERCQGMGSNRTAYPSILGGVTLDTHSIDFSQIVQATTNCFKHSLLFSCTIFAPPCSGRPYPNHVIPPCSSICFAYRNRCGLFHTIFDDHWPTLLNCSHFPDSPDASVCIGYHEAREQEITECAKGEVKCGNDRCIKTSWMCDGFQDCDDNLDEAHCATCSSHELMCSPASSLCINKTQGCDGSNDCYMNVDEHFCVRMNTELDMNVLEVYNSVSATWEEVCQEGWTTSFSDLACRQLGYKESLATYYELESNANKSKISFLRNDSDPDKLQSYMSKGYAKCSSGYVVKLVCWETVCGVRPAYFKSATRVVGGDEVKPGAWPWMASLHGGSARKFFCGATVINPQWILTAGHCVGGGVREKSYWMVKTGSTRRVAYSEHRQVRKVRELFVHPDFSINTVDNDIALIQLDKPLAMNDFVRPICLPDHQPDVGTRCYATGWGKTTQNDMGYEPALRQVSVDVTSWEACRLALTANVKELPYTLTENMFCAGGAHAHDACQGDSGGPLLCRLDNTTDHWYQGGIVSWGVVCGQPNTPGVYTKLPRYINWIHDITANYSYSMDGSNNQN